MNDSEQNNEKKKFKLMMMMMIQIFFQKNYLDTTDKSQDETNGYFRVKKKWTKQTKTKMKLDDDETDG